MKYNPCKLLSNLIELGYNVSFSSGPRAPSGDLYVTYALSMDQYTAAKLLTVLDDFIIKEFLPTRCAVSFRRLPDIYQDESGKYVMTMRMYSDLPVPLNCKKEEGLPVIYNLTEEMLEDWFLK